MVEANVNVFIQDQIIASFGAVIEQISREQEIEIANFSYGSNGFLQMVQVNEDNFLVIFGGMTIRMKAQARADKILLAETKGVINK